MKVQSSKAFSKEWEKHIVIGIIQYTVEEQKGHRSLFRTTHTLCVGVKEFLSSHLEADRLACHISIYLVYKGQRAQVDLESLS